MIKFLKNLYNRIKNRNQYIISSIDFTHEDGGDGGLVTRLDSDKYMYKGSGYFYGVSSEEDFVGTPNIDGVYTLEEVLKILRLRHWCYYDTYIKIEYINRDKQKCFAYNTWNSDVTWGDLEDKYIYTPNFIN